MAVDDGYGVGGAFGADSRGGELGGGEVDVAAEEGGTLAGDEGCDCGAVAPACGVGLSRGCVVGGNGRVEPSPMQPMPVMRATLPVRSWRGIENWRRLKGLDNVV